MKRINVRLKPSEREFLKVFKSSGRRSQREYDRANILLLLDKGKKDAEIVGFLDEARLDMIVSIAAIFLSP